MIKQYLLILTFLTCAAPASTQGTGSNNVPAEATIPIGDLNMNKFRSYELDYNDILGIPYLEKEMLTGYIVAIDKQKTHDISLQYDIYRQEFFYVDDQGHELVLNQNFIREIVMTGKHMSYHFKRINPRHPLRFYDILYESDQFIIYGDLDIQFTEGKDHGISKLEPKFSRSDTYYVLQKGKPTKRIKLKKKELFKFFTREDQLAMEKVASDNDLSFKKPEDLKLIFRELL